LKKLPIIYSEKYNIRFFGLEKSHPFDAAKYGKVYRYLTEELGIHKERFYRPRRITQKELLSVHRLEYLKSLKSAVVIAQIAELPGLAALPGWLLGQVILKPMQYATAGTLLAVELAFQYGWSINLAGGYHHAQGASGEGFCFYADIPIAVCAALKKNPNLSVLVVDLDVHQSNGCAHVFKHDPHVRIFDVYNHDIYPWDKRAQQYVDFKYPVASAISETDYLALIEKKLSQAIQRCSPKLLIYNAGTDILTGDPLGGMSISEQGIIHRDAIVFRQAQTHNIPIVMLLAGGYTRQSASVIGYSIEHLLKTVMLDAI
jgi:histone deacetylase 11